MVVGKKKQTDKNKEAGNLEFSDAKVQSKANMDIKSGKREIVASDSDYLSFLRSQKCVEVDNHV